MTRSPETIGCHPDAIDVGGRHRHLDDAKVKALAKSIDEIGLKYPIHVRRVDLVDDDGEVDERLLLVTGAHRLASIKSLGWDWVTCLVFPPDASELDAELWEIDENLMRAELSDAELADHLARRSAIWAEKVTGGTIRPTSLADGRKAGPQHRKSFAADTAEKTGMSKRDINRKIARAEKVVVLDEVKGTSLDKGVELDALAKLPEDEQRDLAAKAQAGEQVSARKPVAPPPTELNDFERINRWRTKAIKLIDERPNDEVLQWLREKVDRIADPPVFDQADASRDELGIPKFLDRRKGRA